MYTLLFSLLAALLALTAAQCPSPWSGNTGDACFQISDFPATFSQCQQHCESQGGSLATIKNAQEDAYVRNLVTTERAVWIGLFESGEQDESGIWEWVDGAESTWRHWQPGEPNEWCTDEDCGLLAPGLWDGWVDASCTIPNWARCLCRKGSFAGAAYRRDRPRLDTNAHDYDDCKSEEGDQDENEDQAGYFRYCRENGLAPKNWDARRQAYPFENDFAAGYQAGSCGFAAWERDEQWAICCCVDPTFCCAWGEDESCKSRDSWDEEDESQEILEEEILARMSTIDAIKRELDAMIALVVVLLMVVVALIVYLVPWRRRPAFTPALSVELNPTTYNELGRRGSVDGI